MKKKTLLMVVLCTATLTLVACGNKETTTDATATGTSAPTQSVTDNVTDTPTVTEPTVAPVEPDTEVPTTPTEAPTPTPTEAPTPTPTEAPTPTPTEAPTPTPTEAPKELTLAEKYAIDYPFMEVEIFEDVKFFDDYYNSVTTNYMFYIKNNSNECYSCGYCALKPGTGHYLRNRGENSYDNAMFSVYREYAPNPVDVIFSYMREDELHVCEDENCQFTSWGRNCLSTSYDENLRYCSTLSVVFFNADGKPIYCAYHPSYIVQNVGNQLHVDISSLNDIEWTTAKISYEVSE